MGPPLQRFYRSYGGDYMADTTSTTFAQPPFNEITAGGIAFVESIYWWVLYGNGPDGQIYDTRFPNSPAPPLFDDQVTAFQPAATQPTAPVCFLEGTNVLALINNKETYVPIQTLRMHGPVLASYHFASVGADQGVELGNRRRLGNDHRIATSIDP